MKNGYIIFNRAWDEGVMKPFFSKDGWASKLKLASANPWLTRDEAELALNELSRTVEARYLSVRPAVQTD